MDLATRKRLYNNLSPDEPLDPSDPRNVDIDHLPGNVRGKNFVESLERKILLANVPGCTFVTAQRGAGLTTELRRLGAKLAAQDGAHRFVVHIAAQDVVDMSSILHAPDLLFAIWVHAEQAVANTLGKRISEHTHRLWKRLTQIEVDVSLPNTLTTFPLDPRTIETMRARFEVDRFGISKEIRSEMVLLQDAVKQAGFEGLVVIVDGLNRLRGLSTNWREVLDSAERVFCRDVPQWQLPIPIVMTAPWALLLRPGMHLEFLPYLPVTSVFRGAKEQKMRRAVAFAAGKIVGLRVGTEEWWPIFEGDAENKHLVELARMSAGCIRDLLRLFQECVLVDQIDDTTLHRVISEFCDRWRRLATQDMLRALVGVHRTRTLDSMDRVLAEEAISSNFVVRDEPDGRFRVHPALHARLPNQLGNP